MLKNLFYTINNYSSQAQVLAEEATKLRPLHNPHVRQIK